MKFPFYRVPAENRIPPSSSEGTLVEEQLRNIEVGLPEPVKGTAVGHCHHPRCRNDDAVAV